jgi:hypothetical protein
MINHLNSYPMVDHSTNKVKGNLVNIYIPILVKRQPLTIMNSSMYDIKPVIRNLTLRKHCCITTSFPQRNDKIMAARIERSMNSNIKKEDTYAI